VPVAAGALYPVIGLLLSPMIARAAMTFSSVSVIVNALRLSSAARSRRILGLGSRVKRLVHVLLVLVLAGLPAGAVLCEGACTATAPVASAETCHGHPPDTQRVRVEATPRHDCQQEHGTPTFLTEARQEKQSLSSFVGTAIVTPHAVGPFTRHLERRDRSRASPPRLAPFRSVVLRI
jgi:hypothetical protein